MKQEFVQAIKDLNDNMLSQVHTAVPAKIVQYDPATGLAEVQPVMKYEKPDGERMDYPETGGVPVLFPQANGQKATIAIPVSEQDGCLLNFAEQSLDLWMYGKETAVDLRHDLSNAMATPGLFAGPNPVMQEACRRKAIIIDVEGKRIVIEKTGLTIIGDTRLQGDLTVEGEVTVTGDVVAGGVSLRHHTHSCECGSTGKPN